MLVGSPWDQVAAQIWADGAGAYEQPVSGLVAALGRTSKRALVVGANTGFYCILLALEPNRPQVDAVEPWAPAVERLRQNLELNNVTDSVVVWPVAAGPNDGKMILRVPPPLSEDWPFETSASLSATYKFHHEHEIEVPVTTINAIRQSRSTPIDLIIVDAEGFDHEVLKGAEHTVASDRPIIFTEVSPSEQDSLNALLERWGYVTVELEPSGLTLRDRIVRPARTMGPIPDSGEGDAEWWISVMLPPSRFSDLAAAAAECSLPLRNASKFVAPYNI
jgi:FkbM family methyltransferase